MRGTAAAASLRSTVMRTNSEPARARAATCATVAATSAVSVLVIDCTTTGAPPPTVTPPTSTATERRRSCGPALVIKYSLELQRINRGAGTAATQAVVSAKDAAPKHTAR